MRYLLSRLLRCLLGWQTRRRFWHCTASAACCDGRSSTCGSGACSRLLSSGVGLRRNDGIGSKRRQIGNVRDRLQQLLLGFGKACLRYAGVHKSPNSVFDLGVFARQAFQIHLSECFQITDQVVIGIGGITTYHFRGEIDDGERRAGRRCLTWVSL